MNRAQSRVFIWGKFMSRQNRKMKKPRFLGTMEAMWHPRARVAGLGSIPTGTRGQHGTPGEQAASLGLPEVTSQRVTVR